VKEAFVKKQARSTIFLAAGESHERNVVDPFRFLTMERMTVHGDT